MNKLFVSVIFLIGAVFLFSFVLAYSPYYTHPDLTEEIANLWNLKNDNPELDISQNEIEWMRQGAINEDTPARWINHFYDPVHNTGWSGKHFGYLSPEEGLYEGESMAPKPAIASIDWVTNQEYQSVYGRQYGNQTWQKALKTYVDGDRKAAFTALGHILHLIEDASVPDHTRNDTHADLYGDPGSPYEKYSKEYTNSNQNKLNIAENLKNDSLFDFSTIQDAFNHLANYSNNNFFSADTINNAEFNKPSLKLVDIKQEPINDFVNYYIYSRGIYLARKDIDKFNIIYTLDDQFFVLPSYFSHLSSQAVLTGASVLDLFFREAEKYKQNPELLPPILEDSKEAILSYLNKAPRLAAVNISNVVDRATTDMQIYYAKTTDFLSNTFQDATSFVSSAISQVNSSIRSLTSNTAGLMVSPFIRQPMNTRMSSVQVENQEDQYVAPENVEIQIQEDVTQQENQPVKQLTPVQQQAEPIVGNNPPTIESSIIESPTAEAPAPLILDEEIQEVLPVEDEKTVVVVNIVNEASPSQGGGWASVYIPNKPMEESVLNTTQSTALNNEEEEEDVVDFGDTASSTDNGTATSTDDNATSTDDISIATTTIDIFSIFQAPIIINEIAWMGTKAAPNDEWIELYNKTDYEVDLTGWTLENSNNLLINIEGKIPPKGYFLLERTASTTTDVKENQKPYTGVLNNSGEAANLYLKSPDGDTIDFTSQWHAGDNTEKRSMERISASAIGDQSFSWATFSGTPFSKDAEGNDVLGTPGAQNSVLLAYTPVSGEIATSTVWRKIESPYRIVGDVNVLAGADLSIESGVIIQMPSVEGNGDFSYPLDIYGALNAQGTENEKIIFQGGFGSIRFLDSNNATSTLDYVEVSSGGQGKPFSAHNKIHQGALYVENSNVAISHCKIENSIAFGVFLTGIYNFDMQNCQISGTSQIREIMLNNPWIDGYGVYEQGGPENSLVLENNIFTNNAIDISLSTDENDNIVLEHNEFNSVALHGVLGNGFLMDENIFREGSEFDIGGISVKKDFTFQKGVDYYVGDISVFGATLKIEPGVHVKMNSNSMITAFEGSILDFSGTEDEKIIFERTDRPASYSGWRGIVLKDNTRAIFHNVEFNNGGTDSSPIVLTIEGGDVSVSNVHFSNSRLGVHVLGGANNSPINLFVENSTFKNSKYESLLIGVNYADVSIVNSNIFPSVHVSSNGQHPAFSSYATGLISAENNWWGDASGPYHETLNPEGLGAKIEGLVDFAPWSESEL